MLASILSFSLMDASAKGLSQDLSTVQILWSRYLGQTVIVLVILRHRLRTSLRTRHLPLQILRSFLVLFATAFFFTSLRHIGLAEATAIINVNPVLITLGAALFLGERLGLRRIMGIVIAMIGALIIIRPGSGVFSPYALLPLGAAACYSGYTIATRFVGRDEDMWTSILFTGLVGSVVLTVLVPFFWQGADITTFAWLSVLGLLGTIGQVALIAALMRAEAGQVAPFIYTTLIFSTLWGILFFDEFPDRYSLLGMLVIAGAGLYVWHRETRAAARGKT